MESTTFQFTSTIYLDAFRKFTHPTSWEVDFNTLTLCGSPSKREIIAAQNEFNAVVLQEGNEPAKTSAPKAPRYKLFHYF